MTLPYSQQLYIILVIAITSTISDECGELLKKFRYPCECIVNDGNNFWRNNGSSVTLNCDQIVFSSDLSSLPSLPYLKSYSQRHAGYQSLPIQLFSTTGLSLNKIDFGYNSLRRLTEKVFSGLQSSLQELILSDNLLGDALNPIFSSNEFHGLSQLRLLDLSGNQIRALEQGILEGCNNLKTFMLDRNRLTAVPSLSLNGPVSLQTLSLSFNRIYNIEENSFLAQKTIERINLMRNSISNIAGRAFYDLSKLIEINLAFNKLSHLNSDVFEGAVKVESLDLSGNFFNEFPDATLKHLKELKQLNLSSNLIHTIDADHLSSIPNLEVLDLSRNNIITISPNSFTNTPYLRYLDLSINMLRAIEEESFQGLSNLEELILKDNNILLIPASTLNLLPRLKVLKLGYNRITAVSADILAILANRLSDLDLNYNVIREIPSNAFQNFKRLNSLDLSGNLLLNIESYTFAGLDKTLTRLNLHGNKITTLVFEEPAVLRNLKFLDVSASQLKEISPTIFISTPSLIYLNLSHNYQLHAVAPGLLHPLADLLTIDISYNSLKTLPAEFFSKTTSLNWISLSNNLISELSETSFERLTNLTHLDLSFNNILNIKSGTFASLHSLKNLNLRANRLSTFKGEFFITWRSNGTNLQELDLSDNQVSYLFPSSFKVHPYLRKISIARNKFNFFPGELITGLNNLQEIDLSGNSLKTIDEFDFGRLPKLRILQLNHNQIEIISETAFHNSTQLQRIDLSYNNIDKLDERIFQGFNRIELLNLRKNSLSDLPDTIFERGKTRMLENLDLSMNKFTIAPLKSLQKQYFFLNSVNLARNKIRDIPADDSTMVNIKELDLSFNPLTQTTIQNILSEPKTVRHLNLAGTKIVQVSRLETPFLQTLNLSYNMIDSLSIKIFERTTLLEILDLSNNAIVDMSNTTIQNIWTKLKNLQEVDVSFNPIISIVQKNFEGLESLKKLRLSNLDACTKIEKAAFKNMSYLIELDIYGYPKLGYLDVPGLLLNLPTLETLNIEVKDASVSSEQLLAAMNPRLSNIGIWGKRITSISSGTLAGMKSPLIIIRISNTSLTSIPPSLLVPLPRSSRIELYLGENQLKTLTPQILTSLEDRRGNLIVSGLENNPIHCDCNSKALKRSNLAIGIKCISPEFLANKILIEIGDDDLTCDIHKHTTAVPITTASSSSPITIIKMSRQTPKYTTEPDIIWSLPSSSSVQPKQPPMMTMKPPISGLATLISNDDTLIIGIVGGVVAFIALLIIVICVIRLKMSRTPSYQNAATLATMPSMIQSHCNNPSCPCPKIPPFYAYNASYATTLPPKMMQPPMVRAASYATLARPYSQSSYCIPYSLDEKEYAMR